MCISTGGVNIRVSDVVGVGGMVGGQTSKDESSKSSQDRTDGAARGGAEAASRHQNRANP